LYVRFADPIAASVLRYRAEKQTDRQTYRQTAGKPDPATAFGVGKEKQYTLPPVAQVMIIMVINS